MGSIRWGAEPGRSQMVRLLTLPSFTPASEWAEICNSVTASYLPYTTLFITRNASVVEAHSLYDRTVAPKGDGLLKSDGMSAGPDQIISHPFPRRSNQRPGWKQPRQLVHSVGGQAMLAAVICPLRQPSTTPRGCIREVLVHAQRKYPPRSYCAAQSAFGPGPRFYCAWPPPAWTGTSTARKGGGRVHGAVLVVSAR